MIATIMSNFIFIMIINVILGGIIVLFIKPSDYEKKHVFLLSCLGSLYWISKFIVYPITMINKKKEEKRIAMKKINVKIMKQVALMYSDYNDPFEFIDYRIDILKVSMNQDLFSRLINTRRDMMAILIKCSDGEGNIDTKEFQDVIEEAVNECVAISNIAYDEHKRRIIESDNLHSSNKKKEMFESIKDMKNQNRMFRELYNRDE